MSAPILPAGPDLALELGDETLAGGEGLAAPGELLLGAKEELLGLAELRQARLDVGQPFLVRVPRCLRERTLARGQLALTPLERCGALARSCSEACPTFGGRSGASRPVPAWPSASSSSCSR